LSAIRRQSATFDLFSVPEGGTVLLSRLWFPPPPATPPQPQFEWGVVSLPKSGEQACGDGWAIEPGAERTLILLVDGLGHGELAATAAREAIQVFRQQTRKGPADIIWAIHDAIRSTRGAAVAVAEIAPGSQTLVYAGVGNISGVVIDGEERRSMISYNGTAGHEVRKVQEFVYPWSPRSLVVLHSDGLGTHWQLDRYPGLVTRHPGVVAGTLYRDFNRGRDDVTVFAAREAFTDESTL
jgi:hypothetical protein